MPGSAYHKIGTFLSQFVCRIPECNINTSSSEISKKVKSIQLDDDEELISFDVVSLYTNVPVHESIQDCANLLYRPGAAHGSPPFSKETFIQLATIASCNVVMLTHNGYYKQTEGLAMGAPLAPYLANAWMSKFDPIIASIIDDNPEQKACKTCVVREEKPPCDKNMCHSPTQTGENPFKCTICDPPNINLLCEDGVKPVPIVKERSNIMNGDIVADHTHTHSGEKQLKWVMRSASKVNDISKDQSVHMIGPIKLSHGDEYIGHSNTHTGVKPFKCAGCETQVTSKLNKEDDSSLQLEEGSSPNTNKDMLVTHMNTHSGERPFKCNVCSASSMTDEFNPCQRREKQDEKSQIANGNQSQRAKAEKQKQKDVPARTSYNRACKLKISLSQDSQIKNLRNKQRKESIRYGISSSQNIESSESNSHSEGKLFECETCRVRGFAEQQNKTSAKPTKYAKLYERYMDDCITCLKRSIIELKLTQINNLHPALTFTQEREVDGELSALDMTLLHKGNRISTTWFTKKTDTGLVLNFYSLAPMKYKKAIVIGMIHRIYNACSEWIYIHESLEKAKKILKNNQYPESFTEDIIARTLNKILTKTSEEKTEKKETDEPEKEKEDITMFFVQYRGKITEDYAKSIQNICSNKDSPAFTIPVKVVMTMRKLRTLLPSLKPQVEKMLRSDVVYQITCPVCESIYVGQTVRHLTARFREHRLNDGPVKTHIDECKTEISEDDIEIKMEVQNKKNLLTYEALFIKETKPEINKKEEFRSRKLTIKWLLDSLLE